MTELDNDTLDTMNKLTESKSSTTLDDPTLNAVSDDESISIDYDAKESGFGPYTPQVYPGIHNFLFALEDEKPFEVREYTDKAGNPVKDRTVNYKGTVSIVNGNGEQKEVVIRFNQAGFHRSQKMQEKKINSRGGDLIRSLGIDLGSSQNWSGVQQALREADGRVMGRGVVNWEAYCKDDKQVVSTNANTKRGDARWPKGADGRYVTEVQCPKCGAALAGREKITDYKLPQA